MTKPDLTPSRPSAHLTTPPHRPALLSTLLSQRRVWAVENALIGTVALVAALALVNAWQGHPSAVLALAGAMAVLYGRGEPYRRRARSVLAAGAAIIVMAAATTAAAGSSVALLGVLVLAAAAAGLVTWVISAPVPGPALLLVPATIVGSIPPFGLDGLGHRVAMVAVGVALALAVTLAPVLVAPAQPERRALAAAYAAVAVALRTAGTARFHAARNAAWALVNRAHRSLDRAVPLLSRGRRSRAVLWELFGQATALLRAAELSSDLEATAEYARWADEVAGALRSRKGQFPALPPNAGPGRDGDRVLDRGPVFGVGAPSSRADPAGLPALHPDYVRLPVPGHTVVHTLATMARLALLVLASGGAALGLGLDRWYWAPVSAVATVWGSNSWITWHRAVQRAVAAIVGCAAGVLLLQLPLDFAGSVALVGVLFFAAELLFPRNYGYAMAVISAMLLVLIHAGSPVPIDSARLADERVLAVGLGSVLGLVAVLVMWPRNDNRLLTRRLEATLRQLSATVGAISAREPEPGEVAVLRQHMVRDLVALDDAAQSALGEVRGELHARRLWHLAADTQRLGYLLVAQVGTGRGGRRVLAAERAALAEALQSLTAELAGPSRDDRGPQDAPRVEGPDQSVDRGGGEVPGRG